MLWYGNTMLGQGDNAILKKLEVGRFNQLFDLRLQKYHAHNL
jgi:hypothetical protein